MFCPNCGKKNPDDSRFCESCGSNLNDQAAPAAAPAAPPAQPAYTAPAQPAYAPQPQPVYTPPVQPAYAAAPQAGYYQQPAYQAADLNKPLSIGGFMVTYLVLAIPLVNLIMLFVWAFGSNANTNRKNMCRAILIFAVIGIALGIIFGAVFASLWEQFADLITSGYGY